jgi:hypothetical protein
LAFGADNIRNKGSLSKEIMDLGIDLIKEYKAVGVNHGAT